MIGCQVAVSFIVVMQRLEYVDRNNPRCGPSTRFRTRQRQFKKWK